MTIEEYIQLRGGALVRFARLLTGDPHRADDLVQEVLVKAYVHWPRVMATERPDFYLRRMLINANSSWWRRRSSRELTVAQIADRSSGEDLSTDAAERDLLWRLVSRLPPRQRAVLVLRYYEDLDDVSIAEILGCSVVTVRSTASQALAKLRGRYRVSESFAWSRL